MKTYEEISAEFAELPNEKADEHLVQHVSDSMRIKLAKKRLEGYGGWHNNCTNEFLLNALIEHVQKGDMIDVINFAGMIDARKNLYGDKA